MYPKKFASTPVSMISGPATAVSPPTNVNIDLIGPGSFPTNLTIPSITFNIKVFIFKKDSPITARSAFTDSRALRYLPDADSVIIFNSRSEIAANSCVLAFIKSKTCSVWLPSFPRFSNRADILANWNFPNSCSIAFDLLSGSRLSKDFCSATIVPVRSPALDVTIPAISIPNPANISLATFVGLIRDAIADLIALAPSEAFTPPSFIAVRYRAKSCTSPPNDLITGPAFGIASVRSARLVDVWFSTALRKLIDSVSSCVFCLKAF